MSKEQIFAQEQCISSTCSLCGANCRLLAKTDATGQLLQITGDPSDAITKGALCKKGRHAIDMLQHPDRLTTPLLRDGPRGKGKWKPISWEEAFSLTARNFQHIQKQWGDNSLFMAYGYSRDFTYTHLLRFANSLKTVNLVGPETVCWAPTKYGCDYTLGFYPGHDLNEQTECLILWGINKYKTRFVDLPAIKGAVKQPTQVICIDPQKTRHAKEADAWLPVTPGADLALALAFLKVVVEENLYDHEFVSSWCEGFAELQNHLKGYSLAFLAQECGLSEEQICCSARTYANAKAAVIITGNALDHNEDSFQVNRAIATLMAITGNIDIPGGQFQGEGGSLVTGRWPYDKSDVEGLSQQERNQSAGTPAIPEYFRATSQGVTKAILTEQPYPVKAGFLMGTNPMLSWPDTTSVHKAFESLEFLAVSELFMTPSALMADIVFPAASFFEYEGVTQGLDGSVRYQAPVARVGDCFPDHKIISGISQAMGLTGEVSDDDYWDDFLKGAGLNFDQVRQKCHIPASPTAKRYRKYRQQGFPTPSGKVEIFSPRLAEKNLDPLPEYRRLFPDNKAYPIKLTTCKAKDYMFSHGKQIEALRKSHPEPLVKVSPALAKQEGLKEGDKVTIETENGKKIYQTLKVDKYLLDNVAVADLSWWFPEQDEQTLKGVFQANYNMLTSLEGTQTGCGDIGSFNINGLPCRISKVKC